MVMMVMMVTVGCRPYPKPIIDEVANNETAFLIPLEGDTDAQVKFDSVDFLEKKKIASKRITTQVTWIKTGYGWLSGKYVPQARLIKVDRTPVARRWTAEANTGTSKNIQVLEAESKDSIGVKSGMAITAYIQEEDTAEYLYRYPGKDLASVVDNQIFNDCQAVYSEIAAKYEVRDLRLHKDEINQAMVDKVIPEYAKDGITIKPTMGLIGGLVYDNKGIQEAIDNVFIAQTLEAKMEAQKMAQVIENEKLLAIEENEASKRKVKADAEAYEISSKSKAIKDGGEGYLELLRLEVEKARIEKWDGTVPMVQGGGSGSMSPVIPIVIPTNK